RRGCLPPPPPAITAATDGSGPCGDSFDDSLCACACPGPATGTLPGRYAGNVSSTGRNSGDASLINLVSQIPTPPSERAWSKRARPKRSSRNERAPPGELDDL